MIAARLASRCAALGLGGSLASPSHSAVGGLSQAVDDEAAVKGADADFEAPVAARDAEHELVAARAACWGTYAHRQRQACGSGYRQGRRG